MEHLPFEIHLKILQYLDLNSRVIFSETYDWIKPFLYDKSLISNLKIEQECMDNSFNGFWKNFPLDKKEEIKILDISNLNFSKKQSNVSLKFLLNIKSMQELRMVSTHLQEEKRFELLFNNQNLEVLWISTVNTNWPKTVQLNNLKALYIYLDLSESYHKTATMLQYIGRNLQYIWFEYHEFHAKMNYPPSSILDLIPLYCPNIQEIFMCCPKVLLRNFMNLCPNLQPYSVFYRNDNRTYYLFKKSDKNSQILKHLKIPYPKLMKSLNISHFEVEHVPIDEYDLSAINFHELRAFSSNVCRYYEANKRDCDGDVKHCYKFLDLMNLLKSNCEHFELIGCNLRPSIFDESPTNWNENVLIHISKLHNLQSLNLYHVKFTNLHFLKAIAQTCSLKTFKISIKSSTPDIFYNVASIVKDMPYLINFYYEDENAIVPNLMMALMPIRLSHTLQRYSLILKNIVDVKKFSKYDQLRINRHVKLVHLRLGHLKNDQNKILKSYFNDCTQYLDNFKYIIGQSKTFFKAPKTFFKEQNVNFSIQEINEVLTSCTSVLDLEHIHLF